MARRLVWTLIMVCFGVLSNGNADARRQPVPEPKRPASIGVASPTLAPFQHVRFCLRYPSDCASNPTDEDRISVTEEVTKLLKKVNRTVNSSIVPTRKNHSTDLADGWTIAPERGDCQKPEPQQQLPLQRGSAGIALSGRRPRPAGESA